MTKLITLAYKHFCSFSVYGNVHLLDVLSRLFLPSIFIFQPNPLPIWFFEMWWLFRNKLLTNCLPRVMSLLSDICIDTTNFLWYNGVCYLGVAQLVACYLGVVEAVGSSPITQTNYENPWKLPNCSGIKGFLMFLDNENFIILAVYLSYSFI